MHKKRSPGEHTGTGMLQGYGRGLGARNLPSERETQKRIPGSVKKQPRLFEDRGRVHNQQLWDEGAVRWKLTPQRSLVLGLVLRASILATATVPAASAQQDEDQKNDNESGEIHGSSSRL